MTDLMLHCGANECTLGRVKEIPTPCPTESHYPIEHTVLIETVQEKMNCAGLSIVRQVHSVTSEGLRYFGLMEVRVRGDVVERDHALIIGLRNTHDKSFSAGLVLGSQVFVCDNLCFSGEVKIGRKHTRFIRRDLPGLVDKAVGQLTSARRSQEERIDWYKQHELAPAQCNDLLINALDDGIISGSKIPKVLKQFREPNHPDFSANGHTYWRLHNAFTEVLKPISLNDKMARTMKLHRLLDGASGLLGHRNALKAVADPEEFIDTEIVGVA